MSNPIENLFTLSLLEEQVEEIVHVASIMKKQYRDDKTLRFFKFASPKHVTNIFLEPSTRTHYSFIRAEQLLGLTYTDVGETAKPKGEQFIQLIETLDSVGTDLFVIRSPEEEFYKHLSHIGIPIINAGDGARSHPTQVLLDLFTMANYWDNGSNHYILDCLEGKEILFVGDTKNSRILEDLILILKNYGAKIEFLSPSWCRREYITDKILHLSSLDAVYFLRQQVERDSLHKDPTYLKDYQYMCISNCQHIVNKIKLSCLIMHPGPAAIGQEITRELYYHPQSVIQEQVTNGVFVRAALLYLMLKGENNE